MSTKLSFGRDVQGYNSFAPIPASDLFSATIASAGNATVTVPSNFSKWIVNFSYQPGSDIWVAYNGTAEAPAGATFASTTSELLPGARAANAGDTFNLLNNGTNSSDIGVAMYAIS
jgi:hypothetical protein